MIFYFFLCLLKQLRLSEKQIHYIWKIYQSSQHTINLQDKFKTQSVCVCVHVSNVLVVSIEFSSWSIWSIIWLDFVLWEEERKKGCEFVNILAFSSPLHFSSSLLLYPCQHCSSLAHLHPSHCNYIFHWLRREPKLGARTMATCRKGRRGGCISMLTSKVLFDVPKWSRRQWAHTQHNTH